MEWLTRQLFHGDFQSPQTSSTGPQLSDVASSSFLATSAYAQYHPFATNGSPKKLAYNSIMDFGAILNRIN